jgi:hypothetical protein
MWVAIGHLNSKAARGYQVVLVVHRHASSSAFCGKPKAAFSTKSLHQITFPLQIRSLSDLFLDTFIAPSVCSSALSRIASRFPQAITIFK